MVCTSARPQWHLAFAQAARHQQSRFDERPQSAGSDVSRLHVSIRHEPKTNAYTNAWTCSNDLNNPHWISNLVQNMEPRDSHGLSLGLLLITPFLDCLLVRFVICRVLISLLLPRVQGGLSTSKTRQVTSTCSPGIAVHADTKVVSSHSHIPWTYHNYLSPWYPFCHLWNQTSKG